MYHFQIPEVPRVPPVNDNVEGDPEQIVEGTEFIPVGIIESVFVKMPMVEQVVVLHIPSALR